LGAHTGDPEAWVADVQRVVEHATGLVCSVGIGDNRLRAKPTTGFAKPAGMSRVLPAGPRCPKPIGCWPATPQDPRSCPSGIHSFVHRQAAASADAARVSTDGHVAGHEALIGCSCLG
jgi:hypothetical protein